MSAFNIPPRDKLLWYGVDLDQTLAETVWPEPGIGEPMWENIAKMREIHEAGYKVMIHTARYWGDYELIREWLKHHHIDHLVKEIQCGKPLFKKYIDDRAVHADEASWL